GLRRSSGWWDFWEVGLEAAGVRQPLTPNRHPSRSRGAGIAMSTPGTPTGRTAHASRHPGRWAKWLLVLALVATTGRATAATLTRGPYLELRTTHSMTVAWATNAPAPCGLALRGPNGATTVVGGPTAAVCVIPVDGLSPGGSYGYTPLAGNVPLRSESVFRTDDPQAPVTFLVVGDTGSGSPMQYAVKDAMLATPADFIIHVG